MLPCSEAARCHGLLPREASITVMEAIGWSDEITVTFAPHETEKTVDIELRTFEKGRSNGTAVVPINVCFLSLLISRMYIRSQ